MKLLPQDQIDRMVEIMDYILKTDGTTKATVGSIKRDYKLTEEEYQMIYDLCMPILRKKNAGMDGLWRAAYLALKQRLYGTLRNDDSETADKVRMILQQSYVSTNNPIPLPVDENGFPIDEEVEEEEDFEDEE